MRAVAAARVALVALVTAGLAGFAGVGQARASAIDLFGYGARGVSLMGAGAATSKGHAAVYYNAGALGLDHELTFSVGFQFATFDLTLNGEEFQARDAPALLIGFGVPLPFGGVLKDRFTLGLAFVLPQNSILIADIPAPTTPDFTVVGNRAQSVSIMGGLGIRIVDELGIGVSFLALSELDGGIDVAPNATGQLGSKVKSELVAAWSMHVGVVGKPVNTEEVTLTLAAAWRDMSDARFAYPMTVDLGEEFDLPVPRLDVSGIAQFDPMQISFDVALELRLWDDVDLMLAVGGLYKFWSAFENPIVYTAVPEGFPAQPLPNFHDTGAVRFGAESTFTVDKEFLLTPRLGVLWEMTPTPEQTGYHNYLDSDRVGVGVGFDFRWKWLRASLAGQFQFLLERTSTKDPALVEDDHPGFPSLTHSGAIYVFALELGVAL